MWMFESKKAIMNLRRSGGTRRFSDHPIRFDTLLFLCKQGINQVGLRLKLARAH